MKSALVLSDLHLGEAHGIGAAGTLVDLLMKHPDADLILAGDTFDLTLTPPERNHGDQVRRILTTHASLGAALREHRARGKSVTFIPGNHDAALKEEAASTALKALLGAEGEGAIAVRDWFTRFGRAHIEHGHLYDVDNAFVHPLAPFRREAEPLGTALMREFVRPTGTLLFAHAHETTPVKGLGRVLRQFGLRAPSIVLLYFQVALSLCVRAAREGGELTDRTHGEGALIELAQELNLPRSELAELARLARPPTHRSLSQTWSRLYLDQVSAGALALLALALVGSGAVVAGASAGAVSASAIAWRRLRSIDYHERMTEAARESARRIRALLGVDLVVLGHTHSPVAEPGYVNLGSFGLARSARPYLMLLEDGSHELRRTA